MTDDTRPASATHYLKTWPEFFEAVKSGRKTFEVRKNDRGFNAGDVLVLRKYDPNTMSSMAYIEADGTGTSLAVRAETLTLAVTYVLSGFGLERGYVAIGFSGRDADS